MDAYDAVNAIRTRLQGQQAKLGKSSNQVYRAELDALWAAVEVLAQIASGQSKVVVPDWFSTSDKTLFPRIEIDPPSGRE